MHIRYAFSPWGVIVIRIIDFSEFQPRDSSVASEINHDVFIAMMRRSASATKTKFKLNEISVCCVQGFGDQHSLACLNTTSV